MKKAIGLSKEGILLADPTETGALPEDAAFTTLGKTFKDTAMLETAEGENIPCDNEEDDDPEDEIFIAGGTTLKFSTSDLDPESCHKAFGGTLSADKKKWTAPDNFTPKKKVIRFTTKTGLKVEVSLVSLTTRMNWAIKKNGYGLLEHTARVLKPKKGGKMSVESVDVQEDAQE